MYLRKISPSTTCLYSAASMLLRSASAAAQSFDSNPKGVPLANGGHLRLVYLQWSAPPRPNPARCLQSGGIIQLNTRPCYSDQHLGAGWGVSELYLTVSRLCRLVVLAVTLGVWRAEAAAGQSAPMCRKSRVGARHGVPVRRSSSAATIYAAL
jgi:hypothetical protein